MRPRKTRIADGLPWSWFLEPEPDREYLALATFFQLRSGFGLPRFMWYSRKVHRQLERTPGVVGFSFRGRFPTRYWTLSAWESNRHLLEFMRTLPHGHVMIVLRASMDGFGSVRWQVPGSELPLAWADGLQRLAAAETDR